jgi:serine/threonine protein kinase
MQRQNNELSTCGPYKVIRTLGEGGNAVIKLAEKDGEQFALKIMLLGESNTETVLRKTKEEFEIVKALNLPGVMRYHDF